jgi:PAS domain S-box-containing protein
MPFEVENLLKYAVENSPDAFFLCARDGRIIHVNQSACAALGYTYAELTAMRTFDIDPGEVILADGTTRIDGVALSGKRGVFESRHRRKDGKIFPVEITYNNLNVDGLEYSYAFARDISARKETERQREELRFIVDHASDAVYIYDRDGRFRYVNDSACQAMGYNREELLSLTLFEIAPELSRESFARAWDRRWQVDPGGDHRQQLEHGGAGLLLRLRPGHQRAQGGAAAAGDAAICHRQLQRPDLFL